MESREDLVRERAQERLASMDRETLGEMSIEEVKNTYNEFRNQEEEKENIIREETTERLDQIDKEKLYNMSIEEVKNTYNNLRKEVEKEINNKELNKMFEETTSTDSVKTK